VLEEPLETEIDLLKCPNQPLEGQIDDCCALIASIMRDPRGSRPSVRILQRPY